MGVVKKVTFIWLFLTGELLAQNVTDVQIFPGGCAIWGNARLNIFRLPDTSNVYRFDTTDVYGIWETNLTLPGVYRVRLAGTQTTWAEKLHHIPIVPIGGDSTSNAGRLIQNALDSLPVTGGTIYLPPGTHLIDSNAISISKNNTTVIGTGENCILKIANSANIHAISIANGTIGVHLRNFVINGNKGNQTSSGVGINVNGATIRRVKIENVHIRHTRDAGIVFANGASDGDVISCRIDSTGPAGTTDNTIGFGLYIVTSCSRIRATDNTFIGTSGHAAIRVNNNCSYVELNGNIIQSNDRTGTADRRAIFADSGVTGRCSYLSITGNRIFDIDENGIYSNFNDFILISDNTIDTAGNNGIECNDDYALIDNNIIHRSGKHGISINNSIGTSATNNKVRNSAQRGIYFFAANGDSVIGSTIAGNTVWNSSQSGATTDAGIEVQGQVSTGQLRNTTLIGNTCFDLQATKTQTYGISVSASAGKSDILLIVGNNLGRNLTGGLNDGSDGVNETIASNQLTP